MSVTDDVIWMSVRELGAQLRARKVSSVELTEAYLDRLDRYGPKLGAVVTTTRDRALAEARAADRELAAGTDRGPLHGIPYGVKDLLAAVGYNTTWGAEPYRNQRFDFDATVVERLKAAGAVLVAKLSMVELAGGMGYNHADAALTGPGRTPWNLDYWSGGSSSGPGSAVGAALVPFAIGSETWGSILFPSTACAVSGLRPTYGRVSRHGAMALSWTMDKLGPMCRTADDCGLVLQAIAGGDRLDPTASTRLYRYDRVAQQPRGKMRIGVLLNATAGAQPEVVENFNKSLDVLRDYATLEEGVTFPDLPFNEAARTIIAAEGPSAFEDLIESGRVRELRAVEDRWGGYAGTTIFAKDYVKAVRLRGVMQRQLDETMRRWDCVVAPTLGSVTYPVAKSFNEAWPPVDVPPGTKFVPLGGAANVTGMPGIGVPNGFGRENLPTGISFTGAMWQENAVIAAASAFQERTEWHKRRPTAFLA
jgi:aspartyl-tRNA(Asn)/glutamyl-tRNA(Gln) amidotransferase subunit A